MVSYCNTASAAPGTTLLMNCESLPQTQLMQHRHGRIRYLSVDSLAGTLASTDA
jgi:hypothetical protein